MKLAVAPVNTSTGSSGLSDFSLAGKFQLTRAENTGGLIVGAGLEFGLPSGEAQIGAGEEYVAAPLAGFDWTIGTGTFKLQSQAEFEFVFPRSGGDGELEAIEWNSALSFFGAGRVVPLIEMNAAFEALQEARSATILAVTPGAVISLKDVAGKSFDVAAGPQIFVGSDREVDVAFLVSLRHHWSLESAFDSLGRR